MSTTALFLAGALLAGCAGAVAGRGDDPDLVATGRRVAERHCAECHALEAEAKSPLNDAPPMSELYRRFPVERMTEALETGMMDDHPRMPQFKLDPYERDALTSFLSSFDPVPKPRRQPPRRRPTAVVASLD